VNGSFCEWSYRTTFPTGPGRMVQMCMAVSKRSIAHR